MASSSIAGSLDNLAAHEDHHHVLHENPRVRAGVFSRLRSWVSGGVGFAPSGAKSMVNTLNVGDHVSELKPDLRWINYGVWYLAFGGSGLITLYFGILSIRLLVRFRYLPRSHILGQLTEPHYPAKHVNKSPKIAAPRPPIGAITVCCAPDGPPSLTTLGGAGVATSGAGAKPPAAGS
eukprot:RCo032946